MNALSRAPPPLTEKRGKGRCNEALSLILVLY